MTSNNSLLAHCRSHDANGHVSFYFIYLFFQFLFGRQMPASFSHVGRDRRERRMIDFTDACQRIDGRHLDLPDDTSLTTALQGSMTSYPPL